MRPARRHARRDRAVEVAGRVVLPLAHEDQPAARQAVEEDVRFLGVAHRTDRERLQAQRPVVVAQSEDAVGRAHGHRSVGARVRPQPVRGAAQVVARVARVEAVACDGQRGERDQRGEAGEGVRPRHAVDPDRRQQHEGRERGEKIADVEGAIPDPRAREHDDGGNDEPQHQVEPPGAERGEGPERAPYERHAEDRHRGDPRCEGRRDGRDAAVAVQQLHRRTQPEATDEDESRVGNREPFEASPVRHQADGFAAEDRQCDRREHEQRPGDERDPAQRHASQHDEHRLCEDDRRVQVVA